MDKRWLDWNWGVPDWRDKDAYPKPDDLTFDEWRWEFQRRSPKYREKWLLYAERTYRANVEEGRAAGPNVRFRENFFLTIDDPNFVALEPGADEVQALKRLDFLRDPSATYNSWWNDTLRYRTYGNMVTNAASAWDWLPQNPEGQLRYMAMTFDLEKPLKPQLEEVKNYFANFKPAKHRRRHIESWPTYLRILDARYITVTWRKIYEVILQPDPELSSQAEFDSQSDHVEQTTRAKWEAAQELMNNFPD